MKNLFARRGSEYLPQKIGNNFLVKISPACSATRLRKLFWLVSYSCTTSLEEDFI